MHYWIVVLWLWISSLWRKRPLTQKHYTNFRVWPWHLDFNFHMNNACYFTAMELSRIDHALCSRYPHETQKRGWKAVLCGCSYQFRRQLKLFQKYTVSTQIIGCDPRWVFIEHEIYSGNTFIGRGVARLGLTRIKNGTLVDAKEWLSTIYGQQFYERMLEQGKNNEKICTFIKHDNTLKEK